MGRIEYYNNSTALTPNSVAYADGEVRQQYEVIYIGRPISGEPRINEEADDVRWIALDDLASHDIHPSIHKQINRYLTGAYLRHAAAPACAAHK